jgi:predicted nucleic acid-binding protein
VTPEPVIVDSSTLLNFVLTGTLELLLSLPTYSVRIPPRVYAEIEPGRGREALLPVIEQGRLRVEILTEDEMRASEGLQVATPQGALDPGEAQVVAVAVSRGWRALVDDKGAQRVLKSQTGERRWLTTPEVIVEAIRRGCLTPEDADALRQAMEEKASFRMKGAYLLSRPVGWRVT